MGRNHWRVGGVGILLVFFCYVQVPRVQAETVSVTATVVDESSNPPANPTIQFSGWAAPDAFVVIRRDTTVVGSVSAGTDGSFTVLLSNQPAGQQTYFISALDVDGHALAPVTFAINLLLGSTTLVTNVFLGPSIKIDNDNVKLGEFVTLSGTSAPSSIISLTLHSVQATNYTVTSDTKGRWSKVVNTQDIGVGTHTAQARANKSGSIISEYSASIDFSVNPLGQCDGKKTADLNCDGKVNLTDFSILLFFWQQRNPSNPRSDINADSQVTIVDFSIMLFQWTN